MSDGIDLSTVQIHNSHDVTSWPATATITRLEFRPTGVHVEHTRNQGPGSWPNFRPPGWDGDLQYTLWIFVQIAGQWHGSGCIQFWQSCDQNGGPPEEFARNWYYAADRWAPMTGHQPAPGELVGFMVTAGDARNSGAQSVQERSNLVAIPFPVSGAVYMPKSEVTPVAPAPDPIPAPSPTPTPTVVHTSDGLDDLRREIAELSRKVDTLLARSAPVYRGVLPGVPALGVPAGTVVLKPES
jgi:hypothetical protein